MLIMKKKFDIRQWVMVTDFNPLTIWYFNRCYARFGVEDFNMNNLDNRYSHLTNNSIVKNSEMFYASEIEGCMWHSEELEVWLLEKFGRDVWNEDIVPKVKAMIINSLECVQDTINPRKNSFELFGYDVMLDEDANPWLIEVNSSPAMDYSTAVTEELVKEVLDDIVKVIADYHYASKKRKPKVETGKWECIYRAKREIQRPVNSFGLSLLCEGKAIKKTRG
jgi:tubulin monoglycylase TTLL3/8